MLAISCYHSLDRKTYFRHLRSSPSICDSPQKEFNSSIGPERVLCGSTPRGEKTGYQVLNAEKLTTTVVLEKTKGSISMVCSPDEKSIAASF
jgi:hypothetical protein